MILRRSAAAEAAAAAAAVAEAVAAAAAAVAAAAADLHGSLGGHPSWAFSGDFGSPQILRFRQ